MILFDVEQGSQEWLALRAGLATASRFADAIAQIKSGEAASRRQYRIELVIERLTKKPIQKFENQAMVVGREREPEARSLYEATFGAYVSLVGLCKHDTLEAACSPDGFIDSDGGIEIKCPTPATHFQYLKLGKNSAPSEYVAQIQGNMWITGRKWWDFVSYCPEFPENMRLIRRRVFADEEYIAGLSAAIEVFLREVQRDYEFALAYKE